MMSTTKLTRTEIEAMPAGRELDALVAEHVMGWKRRVGGKDGWYPWQSPGGGNWFECHSAYENAQLWDKLVADGWGVEVTTWSSELRSNIEPHARAVAALWKHDVPPIPAQADTRYEALAKAALIAYTEAE